MLNTADVAINSSYSPMISNDVVDDYTNYNIDLRKKYKIRISAEQWKWNLNNCQKIKKKKKNLWRYKCQASKNACYSILLNKFETKMIRIDIYFLSWKKLSMAKSKIMFVYSPDLVSFQIKKKNPLILSVLSIPNLVMAWRVLSNLNFPDRNPK